jgi:membrane-associated protein
MLASGLLAVLTGKPGLMALLTHHWLLGVAAVAGVVFLETALVVMPFLPGDSLLVATGALLGQGRAATITIGRFVPVVRSVAPFVAGLAAMRARRFAVYNLLGALLWCGGMIFAGSWLGGIDWVQAHLALLPAGVVALSLLSVALHLSQRRRPA